MKATPSKRAETVEAEKQAGEFVHREIVAARDAALASGASTNVLNPLSEARIASEGLSYSLGSPANRWERSGDELAQRLGRLENKLDTALDEYRKSQAPLVGKKIEGTGLFQIGYFTNAALIVGLLFLVYAALKIVSLIYPPVGLGVSGISAVGRVSSSLLKKGFEQVISGSEHFKEALEKSGLEESAKKEVLNLFRLHQMGRQDKDVQDLVKDLTK